MGQDMFVDMSTKEGDYGIDETQYVGINIVVGKVNDKYLINKIRDNRIIDSLLTETTISTDKLLSCCKIMLYGNSLEAGDYLTSRPN